MLIAAGYLRRGRAIADVARATGLSIAEVTSIALRLHSADVAREAG